MLWVAGAGSLFLLVLLVVGLVDLFRNRRKMETAQVVIWILVLVLPPIIGLITYLFWRITRLEILVGSQDSILVIHSRQ